MTKREALLISHREHFTVPEWVELESCIKTIDRFDISRVAAEKALLTIRDKKLYKPYKNLTDFCVGIFGWSPRHAQRMLKHEEVLAALPDKTTKLVAHESQSRELAKVPEYKRSEILKLAERVYSKDGKITAKGIKAAREKVVGPVDAIGFPIPEGDTQYYWERKQEVQDILTRISALKSIIEHISRTDPLFAYVRLGNVEGELHSAYNQIKGALPAYVCVTCNGVKPKDCGICHGTGLLSEFAWKHGTSMELKKKRTGK